MIFFHLGNIIRHFYVRFWIVSIRVRYIRGYLDVYKYRNANDSDKGELKRTLVCVRGHWCVLEDLKGIISVSDFLFVRNCHQFVGFLSKV